MFENYAFFKSPNGGVYGVALRVIEAGFIPEEGHVEATQEEKEAFIQKAIEQSSLPQPKTPEELQMVALTLKEKGMLPERIKMLVGVDLGELDKKTLKRLKSLKSKQEADTAKRLEVQALQRQKETEEEDLRLAAEKATEERTLARKARREAALEEEKALKEQDLTDKIAAHLEIAKQEEMGIFESDIALQREVEAVEKASLRKERREMALEAKRLVIEKASQQHLEDKRAAHKKVVEERAARRQRDL